ncbi:MAG: ribbon-helix-helix domain-containing protein [Smithella sp.]|jgi:predicted transcriptional regulator
MGEKKIFSTRIDDDLVRKLKHLAVDENKSLGNLLEEAIQELLKKYDKKSKK